MDSVSPQDVYARHLVSRRGYPLWTPEPSLTLPDLYREQGLRIGDVGVVVPDDGSFDVFFNICLPPTHVLYRETGVPDNFTQVFLESRDIAVFPEAESSGRIISNSSVARIGRQASDENTTSIAQPGPLNYEFALSSKEGALLILPEGAERYYLRNQRPFLEEAIRHAVDWYNFAEQRLGRLITHDSLYLITGFYKARSWSLASYQHPPGSGVAHAQFKAVQVGRGNISTSYTWETTRAFDWRVGPAEQYYNGTANQSIFIQGFKIAVRSSILGAKRVKVKADFPAVRPQKAAFYNSLRWPIIGAGFPSSWFSAPSTSSPKETDPESNVGMLEDRFNSVSIVDDGNEDIIIHHIPQVEKPFHPSDIINEHLLRTHPSASIAITHDNQWSMLLEDGFLEPEELAKSGCLEARVRGMLPVSREGVVYLQGTMESVSAIDDTYEIIDAEEAGSTYPIKRYDKWTQGLEKLLEQVNRESSQLDPATALPRELSKAPTASSYGGKSPRANPLRGGKSMTGMVKQQSPQTSLGFVPDTPELLKKPTSSSSRAATAAKLPESVLKGETTQVKQSYKKETPHSKNEPSVAVSPPDSLLSSHMKLPTFNLNWQLLPFNPGQSKLLIFDVALPVDGIVFEDRGHRTKPSNAELDAPAANPTLTRMLMMFECGPFFWDMYLQNNDGIRCRDVFEVIHKKFNVQLTPGEQMLVNDRKAVEDAFQRRLGSLPDTERTLGWKRVDVLLHRTIFFGLTQLASGDGWALNLGAPSDSPVLS